MNELELVLDDCLQRIADGQVTIEECLAQYGQYAGELKPLLHTAARLSEARKLRPSASYKVRGRARLMSYAQARPPARAHRLRPAWQITAALAALTMVLLVSTTAFAQSALPGQPLYAWKLDSEHVWRALSLDPVGVDLILADRRAEELALLGNNPTFGAEAQADYHEALAQLASDDTPGNGPRIEKALKSHEKKLKAAGIHDPDLEKILHGKP